MLAKGPVSTRVAAALGHLGGPVGRYAVICVVLAVLLLPFRLWLDRGDPFAEIVVATGLQATIVALMAVAFEWMPKRGRGAAGAVSHSPPPQPPPARRRTSTGRGAFVGLGVGVPFYGGLIALSLVTDRSRGYPTIFAIVLVGLVAATIGRRKA